ncbi:DUF4158 domain-containing protein, partial [Gluconobacter cerinus]
LLRGEQPPAKVLEILSRQFACSIKDFAAYAARTTTLREHRSEIEQYLGLRSFTRSDLRDMLILGIEVA